MFGVMLRTPEEWCVSFNVVRQLNTTLGNWISQHIKNEQGYYFSRKSFCSNITAETILFLGLLEAKFRKWLNRYLKPLKKTNYWNFLYHCFSLRSQSCPQPHGHGRAWPQSNCCKRRQGVCNSWRERSGWGSLLGIGLVWKSGGVGPVNPWLCQYANHSHD